MMMTFVLPRLSQTFLKMKIPLPTPTRILLETGKFIGENTFSVLLGLVIFIAIFVFLFSYHKTKTFIVSRLANFPVIKNLFRQIDLARFSRTLATLLQSGVPIVTALSIASQTLSQFDMQKVAGKFEKGVTEGKTIADILSSERKKTFPPLMVQTIRTGEKTGTLDTVLLEISEYYEAELEDSLKEFTAILEPIIMLIIGVAVGAMVIMIIAPIYSVMGTLQDPGLNGL
jgi:type IV pilus assembly protein PilC